MCRSGRERWTPKSGRLVRIGEGAGMKACPECGCRVYALGCVNCNETDYIERDFADELREIREAEWADERARERGDAGDSAERDRLPGGEDR